MIEPSEQIMTPDLLKVGNMVGENTEVKSGMNIEPILTQAEVDLASEFRMVGLIMVMIEPGLA